MYYFYMHVLFLHVLLFLYVSLGEEVDGILTPKNILLNVGGCTWAQHSWWDTETHLLKSSWWVSTDCFFWNAAPQLLHERYDVGKRGRLKITVTICCSFIPFSIHFSTSKNPSVHAVGLGSFPLVAKLGITPLSKDHAGCLERSLVILDDELQ